MNRARIRLGFVVALVALVAALAGCRDAPVEPRVRIGVQGAMLSVRVENHGAAELQAPTHFLDGTRRHELALWVSTEGGHPVERCRAMAPANGEAGLQRVPPKTAVTIEVPLVSIMDAYCLDSGRPYRVQAALVGGVQPAIPSDIASNPLVLTLNQPPAE